MKKNIQLTFLAALIIGSSLKAQTGKTPGNTSALFNSVSGPVKASEKNNTVIPNRGCGTGIPSEEWETAFQKQIEAFKETHTNQSGKIQNTAYTIPVIFHVIHGGQSVGTYPNLAQGQLNSQITVLNQDYGGIGYNSSGYPSGAFSAYATAAGLSSANIDGNGRVAIANCGVQFCLATKDTLGNTLAEPGIERISYVSKGWANPNSFSSVSSFQNFINNTVKPQTIWNVSKYLNIWVTDENVSSVGLLGYATFPVTSGLSDLAGPFGTSSTDGFWAYAQVIGSNVIYPAGTYSTPFDKGRTCTHEIGHWLGLRHIWGDLGQCAGSDYCVDTPPQKGTAGPPAGCYYGMPTYPQNANSCTRPDGIASANVTNVNGDMFMNFMDYTDDPGMYMFTTDQATRIQTAMANSPYRKFLGTQGLCSAPVAFCGDTITNVSNTSTLTLATAGTDTTVPGCSPKAGYIFGSNCYQDQEKAEYFPFSSYSSVTTPKITSVIVIFYKDGTRGTGGNSSTPVNLKLYTGTMAGGPTGTTTPLGVVNSNIGNILSTAATTSVNYCGQNGIVYVNPILRPYRFVTTSPISAPASNGFFASLTLPTTAGDTAVVMHSAEASGKNWECWSDNTWHNLATAWGGLNASMAILPVISCNYVGVNENSILDRNITLMPNPSTGLVNIVTTLPNSQSLNIRVMNTLGQLISNTEFSTISSNVFTIDLSSKDNGVYFVSIGNGEEQIVKRVVIAK